MWRQLNLLGSISPNYFCQAGAQKIPWSISHTNKTRNFKLKLSFAKHHLPKKLLNLFARKSRTKIFVKSTPHVPLKQSERKTSSSKCLKLQSRLQCCFNWIYSIQELKLYFSSKLKLVLKAFLKVLKKYPL